MSKDKRNMPAELATAQRELLMHRAALKAHASQVKAQLHSNLSSKGMLAFAAGTGFLVADLTRPSPVIVAPEATEKQKKQAAKRKSVDANSDGQDSKNGKAKSGVQKIDDLIKTTMHMMAWARTFEALANRRNQSDG